MRTPVHASSNTTGFPLKTVSIQTIEKGIATCIDGMDGTIKVNVHSMRAKTGEVPQVGETWYVDRSMGLWTFAMIESYLPRQGVVTFAAADTGKRVELLFDEPDANYGVLLSGSWGANFWFSNVTTEYFDLHSSTAPGSASPVCWKLLRNPT